MDDPPSIPVNTIYAPNVQKLRSWKVPVSFGGKSVCFFMLSMLSYPASWPPVVAIGDCCYERTN